MRTRRWLRRIGVFALVLLAASAGISWLLRTRNVHRYFSARLEAAFGRPVEVGSFGFNLLDGLRLHANSVTVAEDPRFGHEYFLRAERLTAGLRWRSLVRGQFEFGTLSLTRPSLNLVRSAEGHWNVENWLPPPAPAVAPARQASGAAPPTRLYRMEVDTGRINFKRGVDKHPFALVDVQGHLEQESAGRWRLDLEARPARAAVALQEAGTLSVRGRIAGTSARLQPADLVFTWQGASLADALRLASGYDQGVRGRFAVEWTARSEPPGAGAAPARSEVRGARWSFSGTARLSGVHRWDLPPRAADPALNFVVEGQWRRGEAHVEFSKCVLEAPQSNVRAVGIIAWAPSLDPQFQFRSTWIALPDLLAWYRAFRPGVAEDLTLEGHTSVALALAGWPPRLVQGAVESDGARLQTALLPQPVRVGRFAARVVRGRLALEPATIALDASAPAQPLHPGQPRQGSWLRLEGAIGPGEAFTPHRADGWQFRLALVGQTERTEDLLAAAAALGHPFQRAWRVEGPAGLDLHWQGALRPFQAQPLGSLVLRGLRLQTIYLNQPIHFADARIELRPTERRVTLTAARGLGARWQGWLRSRATGEGWAFDLAADRLDAAELDRWLGPRARPGGLERPGPLAAPGGDASEMDAARGKLRGRGQIRVQEFVIAPLRVRNLRAEVEIAGREIGLRQAQADFYGGMVKGSLRAELSAQPLYRLQAKFERVSLASLAEDTTNLKDRFAGLAAGELELAAHGIGRENLLRSLEGRGTLQTRDAELRGLDLRASYAGERLVPGLTRFAAADAQFSLAAGKIAVGRLHLADSDDDFEVAGSVDYSRVLDLRLRRLGGRSDAGSRSRANKTLRISGPLDAPRVSRLATPPGQE